MGISEKGLELIKQFEGCELTAYKCPSGVLTIGYGHTKGVIDGQTITQDEADNLLAEDMIEYENYVNNCSELTFTPNQNQFDALVSFTYNCGVGNLATLVKDRDSNTVAEKILLYVNGANGPLEGLVRRRKAEKGLFLDGNCEQVQETLKVNIDGWYARLQGECNRQGFSNQAVDNLPGTNTLAGCPQLKIGAEGNITKLLQERLGVNADGIFGQLTKQAVINFQYAHGLVADGIVGQKTWAKLLGL
jgi:GH24 family phage-related lysozyme (muramidase)